MFLGFKTQKRPKYTTSKSLFITPSITPIKEEDSIIPLDNIALLPPTLTKSSSVKLMVSQIESKKPFVVEPIEPIQPIEPKTNTLINKLLNIQRYKTNI